MCDKKCECQKNKLESKSKKELIEMVEFYELKEEMDRGSDKYWKQEARLYGEYYSILFKKVKNLNVFTLKTFQNNMDFWIKP